jgi:hypothetical protein
LTLSALASLVRPIAPMSAAHNRSFFIVESLLNLRAILARLLKLCRIAGVNLQPRFS